MPGIGIGLGIANRAPGFYSAKAQFFNRIADPGASRKADYTTLIDTIVAAGVWTKLDLLLILAAADSATARTNLKSSSFTATNVNAMAFVADRGFTGDGATSYLDTGFNPGDGGGPYNFLRDSASQGAHIGTNVEGVQIDLGSTGTTILSRITGNLFHTRSNSATGQNAMASASSIGGWAWTRAVGPSYKQYFNGGSETAVSQASEAIPFVNWFVGARNNGGTPGTFSTRQISVVWGGGFLTAGELLALENAIVVYLSAVGAAVGILLLMTGAPLLLMDGTNLLLMGG